MDKYERQEYAVARKIARARSHDPLLAAAPKRRKGSEIGSIANTIELMHELLHTYDLADEPPAFAGTCETTYDAAVARLTELLAKD